MLDEILKKFGCKTTAFKKNGEFTKNGLKAYNKLIDLLGDISELTGISTSNIVNSLDEISNNNGN